MLDIKELSQQTNGKIMVLTPARITVRRGLTVVDIWDDGRAIYSDPLDYRDLGWITQERALELVRGGTV